MTEVEILRALNKMARYLKHKGGCCDTPGRFPRGLSDHYFSDDLMPEKCKCGLQQMRRRIRKDLKIATEAEIT